MPFAKWFEDLLVIGGGADFLAGGVEEVEFDFDAEALAIGVVGEGADSVGERAARGFFEFDVADAEAGFGEGIFELNQGRVCSGGGSSRRFCGVSGLGSSSGGQGFFLGDFFLDEMQGEEYASDADAQNENGDNGPNDGAAGEERFLGRGDEEEFGGFAAVGAVGGHAGGFGREFDVAVAVLAFAFEVFSGRH